MDFSLKNCFAYFFGPKDNLNLKIKIDLLPSVKTANG